jgi:peptide subunit release factor 1 (eRF1)
VLDRSTIDRLRDLDCGGSPVLSVYLNVGTDLGDLRTVPARLKAALRPIRDLTESGPLEAAAARSLKADLDAVLDTAASAASDRGGSMAMFLCDAAGVSERVSLPGPVRDRAIVDRTPYLGPLEAMLAHFRRYCAVVADRRTASIYRFGMGELEAWEAIGEEEVRKDNYGGFDGREERGVRAHAEVVARRLFQATADRVATLFRDGEFDLLMVGGNQANVDGVVAELAPDVKPHLAGTFVVDPGTTSPADVLAKCAECAAAHEDIAAAGEVAALLDAAGAGDRAVLGIDSVIAAANQRAIGRLIVGATGTESGVTCTDCGWLARRGSLCAFCGEATVPVPDLADGIAEKARADGSAVQYVLGETALGDAQVGALLRFPVSG